METAMHAFLIIGGIVCLAFLLVMLLEGGSGWTSDGPKAPPPPKEWMERAQRAPVEKRREPEEK